MMLGMIEYEIAARERVRELDGATLKALRRGDNAEAKRLAGIRWGLAFRLGLAKPVAETLVA